MTDDAERAKPAEPAVDAGVPRLPRGRGLRLSRPQLVRIAGTGFLLVFLVMMQRPCANAVSTFVTGFGDQGSAVPAMPQPGNEGLRAGSAGSTSSGSATGSDAPSLDRYEHLRPGMTDDEVRAVIDRARVKAAGSSGAP